MFRGYWFLVVILVTASLSLAQWPADPAVNLAISQASGGEVDPLLAVMPDGSCYVGWFNDVGGPNFFEVRLQLLDPMGVAQFGADGLLVSSHPHNSFTTGWDLMADSAGNAVLAFTDIRAGEPDVYAYRVNNKGHFLWGPDGVTLTDNTDTEFRPFITETAAGQFAFAWTRDGDSAAIGLQRLTADGTPVLAAGGVDIVAVPGDGPSFPDLVPSSGNEVIVSWVPDFANRIFLAQKFDASGNPVWAGGPRTIFNAATLQIGYHPLVHEDGSGGAYMAWYAQDLNVYAQRLDSAGNFLFAAGGVAVSTNAAQLRVSPEVSFNPVSGELFVAWTELNSLQSLRGVSAQKFSPTGTRLWGASGLTILALDGEDKSFVRTVIQDDGVEVFWLQSPTVANDLVRGTRLDGDGNQLWNMEAPIDISSVVSDKGRLSAGRGAGGVAYLIWGDNRNGNTDVYGQSVNAEGVLGGSGEPPCSGDCNGDGSVDEDDFLAATATWASPSACDTDMTAGSDVRDLVILLDLFGPCP